MQIKPAVPIAYFAISLFLLPLLANATATPAQEKATSAPTTSSPSATKGAPTDTDKIYEPEELGVVYHLDSTTHTMTALAKENWTRVGMERATGFSSTSSTGSLQFSGLYSSFHVPVSDKYEFVFNLVDPSHVALYNCYQNVEKRYRRFNIVTITKSGVVHPTFTNTPIPGIDVSLVKYGESSYKLTAKDLPPGEYVIITGSAAFTFSIP